MKNKSIRFKLFLLISTMILLSFIIAGIGYNTAHNIAHEYSKVAKVNLANTRNAALMISRYRLARALATELGVEGQTEAEGKEVIKLY